MTVNDFARIASATCVVLAQSAMGLQKNRLAGYMLEGIQIWDFHECVTPCKTFPKWFRVISCLERMSIPLATDTSEIQEQSLTATGKDRRASCFSSECYAFQHSVMLVKFRHESAYFAYLERQGHEIVRINALPDGDRSEQTIAAMRSGAPVIAQGYFNEGHWHGRADVLLRIEGTSNLGPWSYEVADTKLAQETRGGTNCICSFRGAQTLYDGYSPDL